MREVWRMDTTTVLAIGGALLLLAGGGAYLLSRLKAGRRARAEEVYHFRCGGCKRRLRFLARQVGRKGKCSHCGHDVVFPPVSQSVD
jgi:hypothetical protein